MYPTMRIFQLDLENNGGEFEARDRNKQILEKVRPREKNVNAAIRKNRKERARPERRKEDISSKSRTTRKLFICLAFDTP